MPQTTPERAARWPEGDGQAIKFLQSRGFKLRRDWLWVHPEKRECDETEIDALIYLIEEWDFGGYWQEGEYGTDGR